ncbi:MAG TPA: c-type cytochrome [Cyclobacteriaceae bacterium]|jgi:cytochrome c553|nr:c-type cytochrome [Cyclobacteriaceae bacterium]
MMKWCIGFFLMILISACWHSKKSDSTQEGILLSGNVDAGRLLYNNTCKTCHGESAEGNIKFHAPTLVNTNDWYLYRQLMNYRNGIRGYDDHDTLAFQMAAMAKTLKDSIAARDIVAYIKILPGVKVETETGDIKNGKITYQSICGSCHGPNASGNEKLNAPRLSGLNGWYLKEQILKFKKSIRGAHPNDKLGAQMITMVAMLPDEQSINDVIAYMQSVNKPDSK